ncbi:MAG: zinc ribbon domain-containing protein [Chloroflexi bacterium]|nr:zinc ribbon domain-containing protein [Chloroflexota bacterium]
MFFLIQALVMAQSSPGKIKNLMVELWPEYDRPETLVIYHVELAASTALPAQVTLRLPGYLEKMHVVAVERDGRLVQVSPDTIELRHEGDKLLLTFSTPAPKIQFEYYDAVILKKEGTKRQLNFDFTASDAIENAVFQVQEPLQAEAFTITPAPSTSFTGSDGLKYNAVEIAGMAANENITLSASYTRTNDELSAPKIGGANAEHAADLPVVAETEPPANQNLWLGYALIGLGAALLLGVGGYWWWSKRAVTARASRPALRQKRKAGATPVKVTAPAPPAAPSSGNFCYRCGAILREDANFCHSCGAERRKG